MKKILIAVFCFLSLFSKGQVYQSMPQYGYSAHRMSFDSTLQIPTFCGIPTLKSNVLKFGAIAFDSCNNRFYFYNPKTAIWDTIKGGSGGGGSTDTTSLSNRINLKLNISDTTNKWVSYIYKKTLTDSIFYVKGDSNIFAYKDSIGSGGGGGSSVAFYLNGGTSQGTIGGSTYYQMSNTAVVGNGVDFTRTNAQGNGLIAQFITDVNQPNRLEIPAGNWNLEFYFSSSSSGGGPTFYTELYKYDGSTFTLISTNSNTPENITGGTSIDAYFTSLAVPQTTLLSTDRLVIKVYVVTSGRTITMHTQNSHLCEIITTFSNGITALNGLIESTQLFEVDSSNTTFKIISSSNTHTFTIPNASASGVTRGLISNAQYSTFNNKIGSSDTATMLSAYLRKVDTTTMLTPYSRKFASAYTFKANNTNVSANETEQKFRDSTQRVYTGTPTWTGTTAPSGTTNHSYQWSQIGKLVFLRINLDYSVAGAALTQVIIPFPSDCPTPLIPTNVGATNVIVYCSGALTAQKTVAAATSQSAGFSALRINAAGTGYELILTRNSQAYSYAYITLQYFAQ